LTAGADSPYHGGMRYAIALLLLVGCGDPWDLAGDDVGEHPVDPVMMDWTVQNLGDAPLRVRLATYEFGVPAAETRAETISCQPGACIKLELSAYAPAGLAEAHSGGLGCGPWGYVCGTGSVIVVSR